MTGFFLRNEQREHLKILREKSPEDVVDLCKLAIDHLANGPNEKKYNVVAKKLNTSYDLVQPTIEALLCLLIDATRANISELEFKNLKSCGFSIDQISILWQFVSSKRNFVDNVLKKTNTRDYRFRDLEWRLEAKIATRCLLYQTTPIITLKFYLDTEPNVESRKPICDSAEKKNNIPNNKHEILVQTDANNLMHIIDILEQALVESKTHRTRNILKALQ